MERIFVVVEVTKTYDNDRFYAAPAFEPVAVALVTADRAAAEAEKARIEAKPRSPYEVERGALIFEYSGPVA